jgi:hypothetical protein
MAVAREPKRSRPPTRWSLGDARAFVAGRGRVIDGRPSSVMVANREPLEIVCEACGYGWTSSKEALSKGRWCPRCTGVEPWTYARARCYAAGHGGQVDSNEPNEIRCGTHVPMQCAEGHKWRMPRKSFDADAWCPVCSRRKLGKHPRKTHSGKELKSLIGSRGRLLERVADEEAVPHTRKVKIECGRCKHVWSPAFGVLARGGWCPNCGGNRRWTVGRVRQLALGKGGALVSRLPDNEPILGRRHVIIQCGEGHRWKVQPANLQAGYWCPKCCGRTEWTLGRLRKLVHSRDGSLLAEGADSDVIAAHRFQALVKCAFGHEWMTNVSRLKKHWCPECASGQGEEICRAFMEAMFCTPFPKCRPDFLEYRKTGRPLELDGYCSELAVAFEHHGMQHYREVSLFKDSRISFAERKCRDRFKKRRCQSLGILLIEIPELHLKTHLRDLRQCILEQCAKAGREVPRPNATVDTSKLIAVSRVRLVMDRAKAAAAARGGECLSEVHMGGKEKLRWRCAEGHEWEALASRIINGVSWCPECGKKICQEATRQRRGWYNALDRCRRYAASKGGELLSTEYEGVRRRLTWKCSEGHVFEAEPFQLLPKPSMKGRWCAECRRITAREKMNSRLALRCRKHAKALGGKFLSEACDGYASHVMWRCKCGFEWTAAPTLVFGTSKHRGTWCPRCRREEATRKGRETRASKARRAVKR